MALNGIRGAIKAGKPFRREAPQQAQTSLRTVVRVAQLSPGARALQGELKISCYNQAFEGKA